MNSHTFYYRNINVNVFDQGYCLSPHRKRYLKKSVGTLLSLKECEKLEFSNIFNLQVFTQGTGNLDHRIINKCSTWRYLGDNIFQPPRFMNEDAESREEQWPAKGLTPRLVAEIEIDSTPQVLKSPAPSTHRPSVSSCPVAGISKQGK